MHTVQFLAHLIENHEILVYCLIFLGIIVEGEFIILCTGILLHLHAIHLPFTLFFVLMGGFTKTFLGYYVGVFIRKQWKETRFLKYVEKHVNHIMPHFIKKPFWSIFISKFLLVNHIVIIYSGYKNIDFKKYLHAEVSATLLWGPGLLAIGYFFSYTAIRLSHEIWEFTLIVLGLIAMFMILDKIVSWFYKVFEEYHEYTEQN